jgi:hypothetical protein
MNNFSIASINYPIILEFIYSNLFSLFNLLSIVIGALYVVYVNRKNSKEQAKRDSVQNDKLKLMQSELKEVKDQNKLQRHYRINDIKPILIVIHNHLKGTSIEIKLKNEGDDIASIKVNKEIHSPDVVSFDKKIVLGDKTILMYIFNCSDEFTRMNDWNLNCIISDRDDNQYNLVFSHDNGRNDKCDIKLIENE